MPIAQSRRRFLTNLAFTGAVGLGGAGVASLGGGRKSLAAEPPLEVTTIRFGKDTGTCVAPQVFEELLRAEGFTDIRYVDITEAHVRRADAAGSEALSDMLAHGEVDFGRTFARSRWRARASPGSRSYAMRPATGRRRASWAAPRSAPTS